MLILGIDPGVKGAIAAYDTLTGQLSVHDMPTTHRGNRARRVLDKDEVFKLLASYKDIGGSWIFLEDAFGLPGQGASAAFHYGAGFGAIEMAAVAAEYRMEYVPAKTWKTAMRCPADKAAAIERASELIPTHRILWSPGAKGDKAQKSGRAEASMLCIYGERMLNGRAK